MKEWANPTMPIAPMIDCVFLLLIYFMISATLERQEADISFHLPGVIEQNEPLDMPDEQIIEILGNGQVIVNDYAYDAPDALYLDELATMLSRFKEASDANKVVAIITIAPMEVVQHQIIVKVMDACARADISHVNFSINEEVY